MVWRIVLVKVYFTDLSEYKIRPVYIFKKYDEQDFMFLPLSSNLNRNGVIISNICLKKWTIDRESIVIIPKIWIIHKTLILKEIWILKTNKIKEISTEICSELWCND